MRVGTGLVRFVLEGVLLVIVAALLSFLALNWLAIVLILAGALVLGLGLGRYATGREPALAGGPHVHVLAADEAPAVAAAAFGREPMPEPEPAGRAPRSRGLLGRRARGEQPAATERAAPEQAVPPPPSEDADEPREWNIWQLDRLARDGAGVDAARDEERALLLMHLRGFAGPDGLLPASFDDLVRESFGELVAVAGG